MSTYTDSLGLEEITPGDQAGLWGNTTNNNLALIDQAVTGVTPISFTGLSGTVYTLESSNGALDEARAAVLNITGLATGANTIIVPNKQKTYLVRNNTGQIVNFRTASPGDIYPVGAGFSILIFCDGNNNVFTGILAPNVGPTLVTGGGTGSTTFAAGFVISPGGTGALTSQASIGIGGTATNQTTGQLQVASGGTGLSSLTAGAILRGAGTAAAALVSGPAGVPGQVLTWSGSQWEGQNPTTGGVTNVFGRTGAITAVSTDYSAFYPQLSTSNTFSGANTFSNLTTSGSTPVTMGSATPVGTGINSQSYNFNASTSIYRDNAGFGSIVISNGTGQYVFGTTGGFTSSGSVSVTSAITPGDQRISVTGAGYSSGMAPAAVQCGSGGYGLTYTPGRPSLDILGGSLSAYFMGSSGIQGNNSATWTTVSDQNLKTNVRSINSALDKLNALNPCHFEYKDKLGETQTGFIAQEFEVVFPGHVTEIGVADNYKEFLPEGQDKIKALDPNLVPYLVKAIQELSAKVDAQAAEITALKAK